MLSSPSSCKQKTPLRRKNQDRLQNEGLCLIGRQEAAEDPMAESPKAPTDHEVPSPGTASGNRLFNAANPRTNIMHQFQSLQQKLVRETYDRERLAGGVSLLLSAYVGLCLDKLKKRAWVITVGAGFVRCAKVFSTSCLLQYCRIIEVLFKAL